MDCKGQGGKGGIPLLLIRLSGTSTLTICRTGINPDVCPSYTNPANQSLRDPTFGNPPPSPPHVGHNPCRFGMPGRTRKVTECDSHECELVPALLGMLNEDTLLKRLQYTLHRLKTSGTRFLLTNFKCIICPCPCPTCSLLRTHRLHKGKCTQNWADRQCMSKQKAQLRP